MGNDENNVRNICGGNGDDCIVVDLFCHRLFPFDCSYVLYYNNYTKENYNL